MILDRDIFFDRVRQKPFPGSLSQQQVDGMNAILDAWEVNYDDHDLRWLANPLAQTMWETSSTMQPIEEYGHGKGHPYGEIDPQTGQAYYGRGLIQLTWRDNYARADKELCLEGDDSCELHADNALKPDVAAAVMFQGMIEGWFRPPNTLEKFFNSTTDDPFGAREIINGDKSYKVSWAPGKTVGQIIAEYHRDFLAALEAASVIAPPAPVPEMVTLHYRLSVTGQPPFTVELVPELEDGDRD